MATNKPIDNTKLRELLQKRGESKTDAEYNEVMNEIFSIIVEKTNFFAPVRYSEPPQINADGTATLKKGTKINFPMLVAKDGKHYYPAFTTVEELQKGERAEEKPSVQVLSFNDYANFVVDMKSAEGFVVDPFGSNLLLTREQIQVFREIKNRKNSQQYVKEENNDVKIGEPTFYPEEMVDTICEHAEKNENINAIWLLLMERNGERSYLLIVDYNGDEDATYKGIAEVAHPYLEEEGMYLDIMPYDSDFGRNVTKEKEPFYKK